MRIAWPFFLIGLLASSPAPAITVARLTTHAHPDQQYSLFLPSRYDPNAPGAALLLLDPRGRAMEALARVQPAAEAQGWIVLSSYQSRSDGPEDVTAAALQSLLDELGERYAYDPRRLYLAGMSGTAKTLWSVLPSLKDHVAGLIGVCGGRPPEYGKLQLAPPAFVGMTGNDDFNYREMFALDEALDTFGAPHRLQVFAGRHGWPPESRDFASALAWLDLQAMRGGRLASQPALIDARWREAINEIDSAPDALERLRLTRAAITDFSGLRDTDSLRSQAATLSGSPEVSRLLRLDHRLRAEERRFAERYEAWSAQLRTPFMEGRATSVPSTRQSIFTLRIGALQKATQGTDARRVESAARQLELAYVGASFYLPALLSERGEDDRAIAALELARAIFPERANAHVSLARIYARTGRRDDAFAELERSVSAGWLDRAALANESDWQALHDDARWAPLLARAAAGAP